jgi:regulator of protease activity HflC (stomatin/prohibitin superfamily)
MVEPCKKWGMLIDRVEIQDIALPDSMKRVMAQEAEALREQRARVVKAEGEVLAAEKIAEAARIISANPAGLELRRFQMIAEVGAEQNSTTIVMMPSQFLDLAAKLAG